MDPMVADHTSTLTHPDRCAGPLSNRDVIQWSLVPSVRYLNALLGMGDEFTSNYLSASMFLITYSFILSTPDNNFLSTLELVRTLLAKEIPLACVHVWPATVLTYLQGNQARSIFLLSSCEVLEPRID